MKSCSDVEKPKGREVSQSRIFYFWPHNIWFGWWNIRLKLTTWAVELLCLQNLKWHPTQVKLFNHLSNPLKVNPSLCEFRAIWTPVLKWLIRELCGAMQVLLAGQPLKHFLELFTTSPPLPFNCHQYFTVVTFTVTRLLTVGHSHWKDRRHRP